MRWITKITLQNYRAFAEADGVTIPYGHHLLIYGENGSGKSSVYQGVKDFFAASDSKVRFQLNIFGNPSPTDGRVAIEVSSGPAPVRSTEYVFAEPNANSTNKVPDIQAANKIKGFLDYRQLLRVHELDKSPSGSPNIFTLLVAGLLADHLIPDPKVGPGAATKVELRKTYEQIRTVLMQRGMNTKQFQRASAELQNVDASLLPLLTDVFKITNEFLSKYFKSKLSVDIDCNSSAHLGQLSQ
ncbi:hypothetical protein HUU59_13310 [bacterium]|nr:hypothetical protein [bacterium]